MTVAATQRCLIDRDPVDPEDNDRFGSSVALSGNGRTLVAGAVNGPKADHHVYTYDWDDGDEEWVIRPVKYYNSQNPGSTIVTVEWLVPDGWANDEYDDSLFGCSVALSSDGSMLAAGAWGYGDGSALIFDWDSEYGSWVQRGDILTGAARSAYGLSVALSGDGSILAVGAPLWTGSETNQGGVYIYDWDEVEEEWVQRGDVLVAGDAAAVDQFGQSVAFSYGGSTLVIGAAYRDGSGTSQGGVYVYDWDEVEEEWVQRGDVLVASDAANYDLFGSSVALSGDGSILAVGAHQWEGTATNQGGVYVYDWDEVEEEWVQRGDVLVAGDAAEADRFGESVAMSQYGTVIAVGAPRWETTAVDDGVVYVFDAAALLESVTATVGLDAVVIAAIMSETVSLDALLEGTETSTTSLDAVTDLHLMAQLYKKTGTCSRPSGAKTDYPMYLWVGEGAPVYGAPVSGRYIKFTIATNWGDSLCAMTSLWACGRDGNKLNNKGMTHTKSTILNGSAEACSNTNTSDYWQWNISNAPATWTVDLGSSQPIYYIKTQGYNQARNMKDFTVHVSDNESDWTEILDTQTADSASAQTFQIADLFDVGCDAHCKTNFGDIRFHNAADAELKYMIDWGSLQGTTPNQTVGVWVAPSPGTSDTNVVIKYGDAALTDGSCAGTDIFIKYKNFESSNDGDSIADADGDWTVTGTVEIDTAQKFGGTRSAKLVARATYPRASINFTAGDGYAIRSRMMKTGNADTVYPFVHGNGSKRVDVFVDSSENIKYTDHYTGVNCTANEWGLYEANNINWTAGTYDLWFNGVLIKSSVGMYINSGYANVIGIRNSSTSSGYDAWIDDLIVRKYANPEPTWGTWGAEEEIGSTDTDFIVTTSLDGLLQDTVSTTTSLDAYLPDTATSTVSLDSLLQESFTATISLDSLLEDTVSATASLDSLLRDTNSAITGLDGQLQSSSSASISIDGMLSSSNQATTGLDAVLSDSATVVILSFDSLLQDTNTATASLDAQVTSTLDETTGLDGILQVVITTAASIDAVLWGNPSLTVGLDAVVIAAIMSETVSLDALLEGTETSTTSLDAILKMYYIESVETEIDLESETIAGIIYQQSIAESFYLWTTSQPSWSISVTSTTDLASTLTFDLGIDVYSYVTFTETLSSKWTGQLSILEAVALTSTAEDVRHLLEAITSTYDLSDAQVVTFELALTEWLDIKSAASNSSKMFFELLSTTDLSCSTVGIWLEEITSALDISSLSQYDIVEALESAADLSDTTLIYLAAALSDSIDLSSESRVALALSVLSEIGFTSLASFIGAPQESILSELEIADTLEDNGIFNHSLASSVFLTEEAQAALSLLVTSVLALTSTAALKKWLTEQVTSAAILASNTSALQSMYPSLESSLTITETLLGNGAFYETVQSALQLSVSIELDGDVYECWVLNSPKFLPSIYTDYDFNSYCTYENRAFAANATGVYELAGDADDVQASVVLSETDFEVSGHKRFRKAYLGISGTSPVLIMETDGQRKVYSIASDGKVNASRELLGKYWKLSVVDFDSIEYISLIPVVLSRGK